MKRVRASNVRPAGAAAVVEVAATAAAVMAAAVAVEATAAVAAAMVVAAVAAIVAAADKAAIAKPIFDFLQEAVAAATAFLLPLRRKARQISNARNAVRVRVTILGKEQQTSGAQALWP